MNANKSSSVTAFNDGEFFVADSVEVAGQTQVTVTVARYPFDFRLVAVEPNGKEHTVARTLSNVKAGGIVQEVCQFDLPKDRIHHYVFQTRTREWIEFKRVALNPRNGGR